MLMFTIWHGGVYCLQTVVESAAISGYPTRKRIKRIRKSVIYIELIEHDVVQRDDKQYIAD